jgi:hypothetical protein
MAYYLGRDIDIAITTEHDEYSIGLVTTTHIETAIALDHQKSKDTNSTVYATATHKDFLFAGPRNLGSETTASHNPWAGSIDGDDSNLLGAPTGANSWTNVPKNVTGLDLSFGVMDEDVAFVGQRNVLKAEIKKDNSITITRKKSDSVWSVIYNDARFGLADEPASGGYYPLPTSAVSPFHAGLDAPDYQECGYRVYLRFGGSTATDEIFVMRNCYVSDYSVTMGADSSQEESITLQTYIDPVIKSGVVVDSLDTETDAGEL